MKVKTILESVTLQSDESGRRIAIILDPITLDEVRSLLEGEGGKAVRVELSQKWYCHTCGNNYWYDEEGESESICPACAKVKEVVKVAEEKGEKIPREEAEALIAHFTDWRKNDFLGKHCEEPQEAKEE
jgi:hypothetical protein